MTLTNGTRVRVTDPDSRYEGKMGLITQNEYGPYFRVSLFDDGKEVKFRARQIEEVAPCNGRVKRGEMEG